MVKDVLVTSGDKGAMDVAAVAINVDVDDKMSSTSSLEAGDGYDAAYAPKAPWQPYECASLETAIPLFRSTPGVYYKYRWMALWPMHRRLPAVYVPLLGDLELTLGEFLVLVVAVLACIGWCAAEYLYTAWGVWWVVHPVGASVLVGILLAARNCFFTFLLGLSHERALSWHAVFAVVSIILGVYHGVLEHLINPKYQGTWDRDVTRRFISGWTGWGLMTLMVITSAFPQLRRAWFTVWKYSHIIMATLALGAFCAHQARGMMGALVVWWIDLGLRWWYMAGHKNPKQVEIEVLPGDMMRIAWDARDNFKFSGGQYIYICIPGVSWCEFHPFSISSTPGSTQAHIHMRVVGDWTSRVHKFALKDMRPGEPKRVRAFIEGPFGSPSIDLHGSRYKAFMIVSGGIGVTPMQSLFNHLLIQKGRGRPIRALRFVWVVGGAWAVHERTMVPEVTGSMRRASFRLPSAAMGSAHWSNYLGVLNTVASMRIGNGSTRHPGSDGGFHGLHSGYGVSGDGKTSSHGGMDGGRNASSMYGTAAPAGTVAAPSGLLSFKPGSARYSLDGGRLKRNASGRAVVGSPRSVVTAEAKGSRLATHGSVRVPAGPVSHLSSVLAARDVEEGEMSEGRTSEGRTSSDDKDGGRPLGEAKEQQVDRMEEMKEGKEEGKRQDGKKEGSETTEEEEAEAIEDFISTEFFLNEEKARGGVYGDAVDKPGGFNGVPGLTPGMTTGRPDMAALLLDTAVRARRVGEARVAVCVCGPGPMVLDLRRIARRLSGTEEAGGVIFDVQTEVYEI